MVNEYFISVPFNSFVAGIEAASRVEVLRQLTLINKYSVPKEEIAAIFGFDIPDKEAAKCE